MMNQFLQDTLLADVDEELFEDYKDSEINDMLNLRNVGDLTTLQSLLRSEIRMNDVVTIT